MMESFVQDLRYALRALRGSPGFTIAAVLALGLGAGANTAVFSVADAVLLRPLPGVELDRCVAIWSSRVRSRDQNNVAPADFLDWRTRSRSFESISAYQWVTVNVTGGGEPERAQGFAVTTDFFRTLGVAAARGRTFAPGEDTAGRDRVAVLSHDFWTRRLASDPAAVGRMITIDGAPHEIVGVMPEGFVYPPSAQIWLPITLSPEAMADRKSSSLLVLARMHPGAGPGQAASEMDLVAAKLAEEHPDTNKGRGVNLVPLRRQIIGVATEPAILILAATAGFVLVLACANVANMQLARAATRRGEIAIRTALGAGRGRIARQVLTESAILSLLGATAGLLFAVWGVDLIRLGLPASLVKFIPGWEAMGINLRVLGFTLLATTLTGLLFGLAPAIQAARPDPGEALKGAGRGAADEGPRRLRGLFVVSQVALALILLVGAGLMVKAFDRLLDNMRSGLDAQQVLTMRMTLPEASHKDAAGVTSFYQQLIDRISGLEGVSSAGAIRRLPSSGEWNTARFVVEGTAPPPPESPNLTDVQMVTDGYFTTMGMPIVAGRAFTDSDDAGAPRAGIVSEAFVKRYWPGENPLGRRVKLGTPDSDAPWITIVGVTGDVRRFFMDPAPVPMLYLSARQDPRLGMSLVIRTTGDPIAMAAAAREQVRALDPDLPVSDVKTMEAVIADGVSGIRLLAVLMAVFGALALVIACVGTYSVLAFLVARRRREIAVRVALGARPSDVFRLVMGRAAALAGGGVAIGLPAALAMSLVMEAQLSSMVSLDGAVFAAVTATLVTIALAAGLLPARRATRVDPAAALRSE